MLWGDGAFGVEGMCEWELGKGEGDAQDVGCWGQIRTGGSMQAHRHFCKRERGQQAAALRAQPKRATSVLRFGNAQH